MKTAAEQNQNSEFRVSRPQAGVTTAAHSAEPSDENGEEATVATPSENSVSASTDGAPPPPDEEGFVWPEGAAPQTDGLSASADPEQAVPDAPLPTLDELVKRIPSNVREALDDLFRARFVTVKRTEAKALKR
ncbi:MAG: hypothetical protein QM790_00220 [Nibricoccus sp.]